MGFEDNLLCVKGNEKFSKLWLAATNTKAFRHCVKRSELEEIRIPAVCKDILNAFSEHHKRPKGKRMTFFIAGQLVYGIVCIYREQVQYLYEYAHDLLQVQKIVWSQPTPPSRKRKIARTYRHGKRRRLSIKFNLEVCFDNESENIEQELELPPGHMVPPLLRDVNWKMERNEPEMFGPMTQEEYRNFMDLVNSRGEYRTNKLQTSPVSNGSQSSKKRRNNTKKKTSPSNKKNNKSKKIPKSQKKSFEEIREAISPRQGKALTPMGIDILGSKDTSVPKNDLNADTTSSKFFLDENLDLRVLTPPVSPSQRAFLPPPVVNTLELDSEVMVPQIPSSFDTSSIQAEHIRNPGNLPVSPICQLAPINSPNEETLLDNGRKRKFFKTHDNSNKISDENFRKQFNFTDTLRCIYPREDIFSLYEMKKKRVNQLWNNPCRSFSNKLSAKHFGKRIKLEKFNENYILNDIVHNTNIIEDKIISHKNNDENNLDIVEPYISPTKVEIETRNENETNNIEIMKWFQTQILECSSKTEKLRLNLNEESLLLKLIQLWQNDIKPINMKTLCEGMKRKEAAIMFFTLMELQRRKFLKLHKNMQNNEVYHIEMRNDI